MRYSQPQSGSAQIDWSNPITRGLVLAWVPASDTLLRSGTVPRVAGAYGVGYQTSGATYLYSNAAPALSLNECSFTALLTPTNIADASKYAVALGSSVSTTPLFMLGQHATPGEISFRIRDAASAEIICAGTSSGWVIGKPSVVTGVRSLKMGNQRVWANGLRAGLAATVSSSAAVTVFDRFAIGGLLRSTFALGWPGVAGLVLVHNRALSDEEVASLAANPWQVFKAPVSVALLQAPSAGGGVTGSLDQSLASLSCTAAGAVSTAGALATTLGALSLASSAALAVTGSASRTLGSVSLSSDGAVGSAGVNGDLNRTLGSVGAASSGTTAVAGSSAPTLGAASLVATGATIVVGGLSQPLGTLTLVASDAEEIERPVGGGGAYGGAGNVREVRAFADLLSKARPTKAAKKRLRRVLEDEALELLPDEPEAIKAASVIAQVVAKKELQAIERRPADAAPLKALPFDPSAEIQRLVNEWLQNEAIQRELEDEFDAEMLLLG